MKKLLFVFIFLFSLIKVNAQIATYKPLSPLKAYAQPDPPIIIKEVPIDYIAFHSYANSSKIKSVDFDNFEVTFLKTRHLIKLGDNPVSDVTLDEERKFFIRNDYLIDSKNDYVWEIEEKNYDSLNDAMKFYCTRNDKYYIYFLIKRNGSVIVEYFQNEDNTMEYYYFY